LAKLYFPKDNNDAKRLSKQSAQGKLTRIRRGIYTDAKSQDIPELLYARWHEVVDYLFKGAIATHITAVELRPVNQTVFITAGVKFRKKVVISAALTIEVYPGDCTVLTEPFVANMQSSAPPRYLMENLQYAKKTAKSAQVKSLGKRWVERELHKILEQRGEDELNRIRFEAYKASGRLRMEDQFKQLDILIGAILLTQSIEPLKSVKKEPLNRLVIDRFEQLADYLKRCELPRKPYQYESLSWRNLSFYESHFSTDLDGTKLTIDEAQEIVFSNEIINKRHQDSLDVLSVYNLVHDYQEMIIVPRNADELLELLKQRHELIMHQRPNNRPGLLRIEPDKTDESALVLSKYVVLPQDIEGTLSAAFNIYQALLRGPMRGIFIQFVVAQCLPFDDGNGRLARVMMNAELTSVDQHKLIVPIVHRDSYFNGLNSATNSNSFRAMIKTFSDLHAYTASIDWHDYAQARATLALHCADKQPDQGVPVFNRQLSRFRIHFPVG
jgi:hypothetical protein